VEKRRIGRLEVSLAGLGCNNFGRRLDATGAASVVGAALQAGVTHFDTADVYSDGASETLLGRALGARRRDVVITTKFGMSEVPEGLSGDDPRWVRRACEQSLARLGSDYIDLYLLHRPDSGVPIADTLAAMNELVAEGKVREIGCSNFSASQLAEAHEAARAAGLRGFACVQNEYNLLEGRAQSEVLAACDSLGVAFVPFFPLAMGLLSGKYRRDRPTPAGTRLTGRETLVEERLPEIERFAVFAERHGNSLLELALGWLASQRQVASVIAGSMTPEQVRANVAATSAWRLSEAELAEVECLAD
jgi:aryl-alcohol dehydrogenase-like predicted oxidoreductase